MIIIILIISAILCAYILLTQKHTGPVWPFSPPVLMVAYFTLVNLPGIILVEDPTAQERALLAHCLWMFGVLLSCLFFFKKTRGVGASMPSNYYEGNLRAFHVFILLGVISVAITFIIFGRIPLLLALEAELGRGNDLTMHQARQMNTLEHRYSDTFYFGQGYLRQIYTVVGPIFSSALYFYYRIKLKIKVPIIVYSAMIFFVVAGALNGQIWVSAYIIIFFLLTKFLTDALGTPNFDTSRLFKRGMLAYFGLICFVFSFRYLQYLQGRHIDDFFRSTLDRIYFYSVAPLFAIFPDTLPYRQGSTWLNDLAGVLPGSLESFAYEVHYLVNGGGWGFTLSPGIVASSYVNFGYIGVIITAIVLTGVFTSIFNRLIQGKDVVCLSLAIYISFTFLSGVPGDLISYAVSLLTVALTYLAYRLVSAVLGQRKEN